MTWDEIFQVAFGKIGLDRDTFYSMTLKEFYNAWIGWSDHQNDIFESRRNTLFAAARYMAANSAFSKESAKKIANSRFPWEKKGKLSLQDQLSSYVRRQEIKAERDGR